MIETHTSHTEIIRRKIASARRQINTLAVEIAASTNVDEIRELGESIASWRDEISRLESKLTAWR